MLPISSAAITHRFSTRSRAALAVLALGVATVSVGVSAGTSLAVGPVSPGAAAVEAPPGVSLEPYAGVPGVTLPDGGTWGLLVAPENAQEPDGAQVELPYVVVEAAHPATPEKSPLIYVAGGPGGVGVTSASYLAGLVGDRDIVILEQRGGEYSTPSLAFESVARADVANYSTADPLEDEAARVGDALRAELTAFRESGHDPTQYTALATARDVVALRQALGYEHYALYGVSWATLVFNYVAGLDSQAVDGVALDSTLTPRGDAQTRSLAAVREILGEQTFGLLQAAGARFDAEPFTGTAPSPFDAGQTVGYQLTGNDVYALVQQLLYSPGRVPGGVDSIVQVIGAIAAGYTDAYTPVLQQIVPSLLGTLASNNVGQYWTITLQDDLVTGDRDAQEFQHSWFGNDQYLQPALRDLLPASPDAPRTILDYDGPVVVYGLTADPITPVSTVREYFDFDAHPTFELVTAEGTGHGAVGGSSAVRAHLQEWLANLPVRVPDSPGTGSPSPSASPSGSPSGSASASASASPEPSGGQSESAGTEPSSSGSGTGRTSAAAGQQPALADTGASPVLPVLVGAALAASTVGALVLVSTSRRRER